jgi:hypothetical protein
MSKENLSVMFGLHKEGTSENKRCGAEIFPTAVAVTIQLPVDISKGQKKKTNRVESFGML